MNTDSRLDALTQALGPDGLITDTAAMAPYLGEQRGLYADRRALAVALPADTQAVAAVVAHCNAAQLTVIPRGGNTGLVGGAAPETIATAGPANAVIVSLERLNRIRSVDADNYSLTAEAGCTLSAVQAAAASHQRLFPLSYAAEADCQIGGNLATNAGGMNVVRYGNARDLALGLEVVLPDGQIWHGLRGLRKDNSGYALKDLFIGAEGTLGIITAATLKLFPAVHERATAIVGLDSVDAAVALFSQLRRASGDTISSCELMGRQPLDYALRYGHDCAEPLPAQHPWYLLVELSSSADDAQLTKRLTEALEHPVRGVSDYRIAHTADQAAAIWRLRNSIPSAQKGAGASIKNDISVPIGAMSAFIERTTQQINAACPGAVLCVFGHIGDGNLHVNLSQPAHMSAEGFLAQWQPLTQVIHDLAMDHQGSFAAEHGVGQLKPSEVSRLKDPVEQALMRQLKAAFDPHNRMNPGKVVPNAD
mgnify:CR=1 FL=1